MGAITGLPPGGLRNGPSIQSASAAAQESAVARTATAILLSFIICIESLRYTLRNFSWGQTVSSFARLLLVCLHCFGRHCLSSLQERCLPSTPG